MHRIINDLEQKTFYLIIPIIISTIFCTNYFIGLWIGGDNIALISNTTSLIVIGYLLFSATMIPLYYYLMSKGHAVKTIYIQAVNTFSNLIFILILFKSMGYYAFVISYILAIVFSFMLMLYYQKKLLNSIIFDSINQTLKLGAVIVILFSICYVLNYLPLNDYLKLFLIPIVCLISSIFLYRFLKVITKEEIEIYLGVNNKWSNIVVKLICS